MSGNDPSRPAEEEPVRCVRCGGGFYDERDVDAGGNVVWVNGEPHHEDAPCDGSGRALVAERAQRRKSKWRDE